MKAKLLAITIFAAADAFLGAFAVGFNSRHALIGDPTIPAPIVEKAPAPAVVPAVVPAKEADKKNTAGKPDPKAPSKADAKNGKSSHSAKDKDKASKVDKSEKAKSSTKSGQAKVDTKPASKPSTSAFKAGKTATPKPDKAGN